MANIHRRYDEVSMTLACALHGRCGGHSSMHVLSSDVLQNIMRYWRSTICIRGFVADRVYKCVGSELDYMIEKSKTTTNIPSQNANIICTLVSTVGWFIGTYLSCAIALLILETTKSQIVAVIVMLLVITSGVAGMLLVRRCAIWIANRLLRRNNIIHEYEFVRERKIGSYILRQEISLRIPIVNYRRQVPRIQGEYFWIENKKTHAHLGYQNDPSNVNTEITTQKSKEWYIEQLNTASGVDDIIFTPANMRKILSLNCEPLMEVVMRYKNKIDSGTV